MKTSSSAGIKVPQVVARVVAGNVPREVRLQAARAELDLHGRDLLLALLLLWQGNDPEIKTESGKTLRHVPEDEILAAIAVEPALHPRLLLLLARFRWRSVLILDALLTHTQLPSALLEAICLQAPQEIIALLEKHELFFTYPELIEKVLENPSLGDDQRKRFSVSELPDVETNNDNDAADSEPTPAIASEGEPAEDEKLSKYQQALTMKIAVKIKMALTGDKEWRAIFLKDSNKLVCSAAIKNPRITDGEVLAVARLKTSNEELIRLITMGKDWVKNPEIKKALVVHPRTPLPKALKYMEVLTLKDLKQLAKSKGVSQALVNAARKKVADIARKM